MDSGIGVEELSKIKKIPMLFVMGKERSGTTLLQNLIRGHPNIVGNPECDFIILLYPRYGRINKWTEKIVLQFIEDLFKELCISKLWQVNREQLTTTLLLLKEDLNYSSVCRIIYYLMRGSKENILLISDKNPIYVLFINLLLKIFPEAKFIHLVREPRDNVNSHVKSFNSRNIIFIAQKWLAYNSILVKCKKNNSVKWHTLLYEEMVQDTESSMKNLCKFLQIAYNDNMTNNRFPERLEAFRYKDLVMERIMESHSNMLQPVNTSNIGKWKTTLKLEDTRIIEEITGEFAANNFNYSIEKKPGSISFLSYIRIVKIKVVYYSWQSFTRLRYKNYKFNMLYTKINIYFGKEKMGIYKGLRSK